MRCVRKIAGVCVVFSLVMLAWSAAPAMAAFMHTGSTDPTTEGWTLNGTGWNFGAASDAGAPVSTRWLMYCNNYGNGGPPDYYSIAATAVDPTSGKTVAQIMSSPNGWEAKTQMQAYLFENGGAPDSPLVIGVGDGTSDWLLWLTGYSGTGTGTLYYKNAAGTWGDLPGVGGTLSGDHAYGLKYTPGATSALDNVVVSVDNSPVATLYRSDVFADAQSATVRWGNPNSSSPGFMGWYYTAQFGEVVPEPSALVLLATGLIGLMAYAWRKRR